MPFITFQVWCILYVNHTLLLEPYQIDRLSFSVSKDAWERSVASRPRRRFWDSIHSSPKRLSPKKKKNNTHVYLRNSRPHFAYVERRISEFIDRFLWFAVDVFFEFSVGQYDLFRKLSRRACAWPWTPALKECFVHTSAIEGLWDTGLSRSLTRRL